MKRLSLSLVALILLMGVYAQRGTGLVFNPKDNSKIAKKNSSSFGFSGKLPASYSLKSYTPYVGNQGKYGTCASWSMAYATMTTQYAALMKITNRNIITSLAFCPYFTHNNCEAVTDGCTSGNYFYKVAEELKEIGAKRYYLPLINCATPNDDLMTEGARNYRLSDVSTLYNYEDFESADMATYIKNFIKKTPFQLDDVKKQLNDNKPVVFGMYLPPSFFQSTEAFWEPSTEEKADPVTALMDTRGEMHGNHAMTIIGYDDNKYGGAFEIMNSWGTSFGDNGFVWVRYADLQKFVYQTLSVELPPLTYKTTTGCIYGDCNDGYGIYKHSTGDMYEGFFKGSKYNGYGIYVWTTGATYAGEWEGGLRSGDATQYFVDGSFGGVEYKGDKFVSGYTKINYDNGDFYEGNLKNGEFSGYGVYKFAAGHSYEGSFENGTYNGLGKYSYADGTTHIGYFSDGQLNGKGLQVSAAGKVWGGTWSYNKFVSGKKYGFSSNSTFDFNTGIVSANSNYVDVNCVSGDCLNGKGTRKYFSGSEYEGEFRDGLENGLGKEIYTDGTVVESFYKSGNRSGVMIAKWANGAVQFGALKNDVWDGYIVYFDAAGEILIGTYKNGTYVGKLSTANDVAWTPSALGSPSHSNYTEMAVLTVAK